MAIVPHYHIFSGLRFDIEHEGFNNSSVIFSPQLYYRDRKTYEKEKVGNANYFNLLAGAGFDVNKKIIINSNKYQYYFALGGGYNHYHLQFYDFVWKYVYEDFNYIYKYELDMLIQNIHRINLGFIIGMREKINDALFYDVYGGLEIRYSYNILNNNYDLVKFNKFMTNFGFTGTNVILGLKIGFDVKNIKKN